MKKRTKAAVISGGVVAVAIIALVGFRFLGPRGSTVRYRTRPVAYADIVATVNETGTVNAVNEVAVGSEVSGTIATVRVDFNSRVRKGEVLATLDPAPFQDAVDTATANLKLAQANLASAQATVGKTKDQLDLAVLTEKREVPLVQQGFAAQSQLDADQTAAATANEDYLSAQDAVTVAQAQVAVDTAQLEQARYNLSRTVITSPIDGIVLARTVSVGQTVAASLQTPTLFTLASSLTDMEVDTSVDEADVGSVKAGQAARITVTSYPNTTFAGTVDQVRVNPIVTQNVVTYDAVVAVHDATGRLLPGMTAQVTIETGNRTHVLAVPVAAVLYRPLGNAPTPAASFGGLLSTSGVPSGPPVAGAPGSQVTVWVLRGGQPVAVPVVIGLSDAQNIEVVSGDLQAGDQLIVAQSAGSRGGTRRPAGAAVAGGAVAGGGAGAPAVAARGTR
jgi:HlyD family secretion protein